MVAWSVALMVALMVDEWELCLVAKMVASKDVSLVDGLGYGKVVVKAVSKAEKWAVAKVSLLVVK